ncbi:carbohydrate kinase [Fusibacter ferrireducens]|uniref:Winged helix-turn-helix transcriptional regulator n=1 Tax=Fusibacter ferrireducens TaxID=2785058 RepID=A0ABR9ZZF2_9FIRM|nr:carbohydrate kinase [Fusibacter ferrireducens]MBF4695341.1 winged helix-turn-helix transcriptional regulator [Fusibacter ferrireducens]
MTDREQEILEIVKTNPMITQEALAQILGIQRSSVAVHISNLIKKGKIKGKGYIVCEEAYVVVVGGCNMDISGKPINKMILHDSNIGQVQTSTGGVGRNIAENLSRLGISVKMISAVGNDEFGTMILSELNALKVDTTGIMVHQSQPTSTYLAVSDETGDMHVAISQMNIVDEISVAYVNEFHHTIENAGCLVIDTNLKQEVLQYILNKYAHKKIFVDTVSTAKAIKVKGLLDKIYFLKPNLMEAELFSEYPLDPSNLVPFLKALPVKKVVISLGGEGVIGRDEKEIVKIESPRTEIVNTTGAGDAFMAGMIFSEIKQMPFHESIKFAASCATHNIEQQETVSKALNESIINNLIKERM